MILSVFITLLIFLLLSALFSAAETGITASSRSKIYKLKMEGDRRANTVLKLLDKKDGFISTILLGNNLANNCASALATAFTISLFGTQSDAIFYVTLFLTLVIIIFAEVLPKTYALMYSERVALAVSPVVYLLTKILYPITFLIEKVVNFLIKIFHLKNPGMEQVIHGLDAIRGAVEMHHSQGEVVKEDRDMLGGLLDLDNMEVSEVMKHRKYVEAFDIETPNEEILSKVLSSQYTRIPVYEKTPDNIVGILHAKNFIRALHEQAQGDISKVNIREVISEPWFVPDTTTLREQLIAFREKHTHFAFVVDEYGTLLGHITLEDILEEIVGNIEDEHDKKVHRIEETIEGGYIVDGSIPIRDVNRELDLNLPSNDANTVAGLIINNSEMIPLVGQAFSFYGYRFEIVKKKRNQITKVKILKN